MKKIKKLQNLPEYYIQRTETSKKDNSNLYFIALYFSRIIFILHVLVRCGK